MNGYQLSRRYWDWAFRNTGLHSPTHAALYAWYIEACNRAEWPTTFEMAPHYAMSAIGVRSYNTYKDVLADLQTWGFVRIRQIGLNQYTPWLLALSNFDEALDYPLDRATTSALSNFDIPLNKARNKAGNNPRDAYTINNKPENLKPENANRASLNNSVFTIAVEAPDGVVLQTASSSTPVLQTGVPIQNNAKGKPEKPLQSCAKVSPKKPLVSGPAPAVKPNDPFLRRQLGEVCNVPFSTWFSVYGNPTGEPGCRQLWFDLTDEERLKAMEHTPLYLQTTQEQYVKEPINYLTQKHFNAKIINRNAANAETRSDQSGGRGAVLPKKPYTKQSFRRGPA